MFRERHTRKETQERDHETLETWSQVWTGRIPREHKQFHGQFQYSSMSGTSQAAAGATGVVDLMMQTDTLLAPDEVWNYGFTWSDNMTETMSVNTWVDQK